MWIVRYRKNPSTPTWFDADRWTILALQDEQLERLIVKFTDMLNSPTSHDSWRSPQIEYQLVDKSTNEVIPWTTIIG